MREDRIYQTLLTLLFVAHATALCLLVPPTDLFSRKPLLGADHPAHARRVHVYREALWNSGLPWGWDPMIGAGTVMRPVQDAGAKPQEALGVMAPWASPGAVVRVTLFLAAAAFPFLIYATTRLLDFSPYERLWTLALLLGPAWLYGNLLGFFRWGLAAFALGSYLAPLALVLFLRFVARPSWPRYGLATAAVSLVFFSHILAPALIALPMLLAIFTATTLTSRWRAAALGAMVLVLVINAFWLAPFALDLTQTPESPASGQLNPKDLTYFSLDHLLDMVSPERFVAALGGLSFASFGLWLLWRRAGGQAAVAFGLAAFLGLFLKFGGSFIPVVVMTQPSRFLLGAFALLVVPAGLAMHELTSRVRIPQGLAISFLMVSMLGVAIFWHPNRESDRTHVNFAGQVENESPGFFQLPGPAPQPPGFDPLHEFVQERTAPEDRLLVQTRIQAEQTILPWVWQREVVGNCYPDVGDATNFVRNSLWGRKLDEWDPAELDEALRRWGITWAITCTKKAGELMAEAVGHSGESVGAYHVFRVQENPSRFIVGEGDVQTEVNRLELTDLRPENGQVVLRYRFHPAWSAGGGVEIYQHSVPEDPVGFIGLRGVSDDVTLHFRPWRLFFARWPAEKSSSVARDR